MQRARAGSKQRVGEVVGVVVVGVPAADQQVDVGGVLPRVEVGRHVACVANDFDSKVGPHAEQGRQQRLRPIAQQRLHGGAHPDRTRETRGVEQPNGVLTRRARASAGLRRGRACPVGLIPWLAPRSGRACARRDREDVQTPESARRVVSDRAAGPDRQLKSTK